MAKGKKREALYRAVKFEIHPSPAQFSILQRISDNLRQVWNEALAERQRIFDEFIAPVYQAIREERERSEEGDEALEALNAKLKAVFKEHRITFYDQVNQLTPRREGDSAFASIPRNWQEETLDALTGAFTSFMTLRKNRDPDARPPRARDEGFFAEIPGRLGFKVAEGKVALRCWKVSGEVELVFPIPEYQQRILARVVFLRKFTLYRSPRDLSQPGRFWVSVAYDIEKPDEDQFVPKEAVYVALGASSLGVISSQGEEVIKLWRPDKYWKPQIESVAGRMARCAVGSRKWRRLNTARRKKQRKMALQQKQDQRETVVQTLLTHGKHFVVSELIVRSKEGKLADRAKPERGGALGLNWAAQNTGSIARLVAQLAEKAHERGGSVRKHRVPLAEPPPETGHRNKIWMAHRLRESFLQSG